MRPHLSEHGYFLVWSITSTDSFMDRKCKFREPSSGWWVEEVIRTELFRSLNQPKTIKCEVTTHVCDRHLNKIILLACYMLLGFDNYSITCAKYVFVHTQRQEMSEVFLPWLSLTTTVSIYSQNSGMWMWSLLLFFHSFSLYHSNIGNKKRMSKLQD